MWTTTRGRSPCTGGRSGRSLNPKSTSCSSASCWRWRWVRSSSRPAFCAVDAKCEVERQLLAQQRRQRAVERAEAAEGLVEPDTALGEPPFVRVLRRLDAEQDEDRI